jgi:hypothetical protein
VLIPKTIESRLHQFCEKFNCSPTIEGVALTEEQIEEFDLPTRPTKREGNRHAKSFAGDSVELDALPAAELRQMVCECIERHITPVQLDVLRAAEESERELLERWADNVQDDGGTP